jgi:hypothetical protein
MVVKKYFLFIFCVLISLHVCAQQPTNRTTIGEKSTPDSTAVDTTKRRNTFAVIFNGKPGKAALYSLILPGGGQIYNKRWWKVPLAWGVDGVLAYNLVQNKKLFKKYDDIFYAYINIKGYQNPLSFDNAKNFRSQARQRLEYSYLYLIIGHIVTVFEAYVDRHLMDFDIDTNISLGKHNLLNTYQEPYYHLATFSYSLK